MKKAAKKKAKPISQGSKKTAKKAKPAKKVLAAAKAKGPSKKIAKPVKAPVKTTKATAAPEKAAAKAPAPMKPVKGKKGQPVEPAVLAAAKEQEVEVILTNADGKQYCRVHDCDNEGTTEGYCRYHYLALWKRNKIKAKILQGGKLDKYIEDLTAKYPDKYLEMLRKDLASEKDFNLIVAEMDVEDAGDDNENEEETSRFIEEVRGGMPTPDDDEGSF